MGRDIANPGTPEAIPGKLWPPGRPFSHCRALHVLLKASECCKNLWSLAKHVGCKILGAGTAGVRESMLNNGPAVRKDRGDLLPPKSSGSHMNDDQSVLHTRATKFALLLMFHVASLAGRKEFLSSPISVSNLLSLAPHSRHE